MINVGEKQNEDDDIGRYLQYLSVDDTGSTCFINGTPEWTILLPDLLSRKIIEDLVYEHCQKYDIDYVEPSNVSEWAANVVQQAFRLRVAGANKKKEDRQLRTKPNDHRILNGDCSEFVIRSVKRTIKQEDSLVRQILYTCWSGYTNDPINLGIMAPTSEGKTYPVIEALKFVPKEDVWKIGQMSTKVLVRQKGILVDKDGSPLKPVLKEIDQQIIKLKDGNNNKGHNYREQIDRLKERRNHLLEDSKILIDLSGKTLVFLEPPQRELWNLLKPILSHDTEEIEYPYVDRNDRTGFVAKRVVVRGYPACIFCSAKDESSWQVWEEIASRFLITSPNMNKTKYEEANMLIAQRKSLPAPILQKILISDEEIQLARDCYQYVKQNIQQLIGSWNMDEAASTVASCSVWIPYGLILGEALPSDRGIDNRAATRIFSLLNIVTLTHADVRPKLVYDDDKMVIATLDDLREVLHITQNLAGMPAYKLQFFKDIFCKLYKSKTEVDSKDCKQEDRIAVTTKELCEHYKQQTSKSITTNNMKTTYLNELQNAGYIDCELSKIDNRKYIFWQVIDPPDEEEGGKIKNQVDSDAMDNNLRYARINLPRNCRNIPENWLLSAILELREYPVRAKKFVLLCKDDELPVTITDFIKDYEKSSKLTNYFVKRNYSTIFGELKPMMCDANDFSHSDHKKLSIAEKSIEEDDLEPVNQEIECEYCNKKFTTAIDVVGHSVAVHPGRAIVAALLKRGIDVQI